MFYGTEHKNNKLKFHYFRSNVNFKLLFAELSEF